MSPTRTAADPGKPLYRLGWLPDPLAWAPWESIGDGRFDDPQRRFRVLYAASRRRGAFIETLARFRPSLEFLARAAKVTGSDESLPVFTIPSVWHLKRGVGRIRVLPGQRWLDLRAPETRETLRNELAGTLLELGLSDLDLSGVTGPTRALTQVIARWTYEHGHTGLAYPSRFDETLTRWAIFEGAAFVTVGGPEPIEPDDADLAATARLFGLTRE